MKGIRSGVRDILYLLPLIVSLCVSCKDTSEKRSPKTLTAHPTPIEEDSSTLIARADSLYLLGEAFLASNQKDSSLYYHEQALGLREKVGKNDKDLFESYLKVGRFYRAEVKYDMADKYFEKAQSLLATVVIAPEEEIKFLFELSNIKSNLRDVATSISLLNRLTKLVQINHVDDRLIRGRIQMSLGNAFVSDNQFEEAIIRYRQAITEYEPLQDFNRKGVAFTSLGMAYNRINDNNRALISFRKAIQNHLKWAGPESVPLATVYLQEALTHQNLGQFDSAQYYLERNLKIRRKVYGEKDPNTYGAKLNLGQFYEFRHRFDSALKYSHESLISLVRDFNDHNIRTNPIPSLTESNIDLVRGLVTKANALRSISEADLGNNYFSLALSTYLLADSVFSVFVRNLKYDDPQLKELGAGNIPYPQMMELAFRLFKDTGKEEFLNKAIHIMEQSRAVLLEMALNRAQQYDTIGRFQIFRNEENDLVNKRSEILRQLAATNLPQIISDSLRESLLRVNQASNELQSSIERISPGYFHLKYDKRNVSIHEIQSILEKRKSTFFEYLWSDEKIYVLAINPYSIETKTIIQTDSFKGALIDFTTQLGIAPHEAIRQENFVKFYKGANFLYNKLIGDVLSNKIDLASGTNLIFSANGPLSTFPFEALITQVPAGEEVNYHLPYLVQKHAVSYAYSAGILANQSKRPRDGNKLLALGFAGDGTSQVQRNGLNNLPGTEREITSIMGVMKNSTNKYYLEKEASEATFKNQVADFDIVHLAIHGVADSINALDSKLVFRSEADTVEDGNLYAHELYSLNLDRLDLAVLSACESGIGKKQSGEGVMSIARGFVYAGCPSLVVSLWKINDRTSAPMMGSFYTHLSKGENLDKALASSKIGYLAEAGEFTSHPAYWAAFLQVGDTRAIDVKSFDWMMAAAVLFGLLLTILAGYRIVHYVRR